MTTTKEQDHINHMFYDELRQTVQEIFGPDYEIVSLGPQGSRFTNIAQYWYRIMKRNTTRSIQFFALSNKIGFMPYSTTIVTYEYADPKCFEKLAESIRTYLDSDLWNNEFDKTKK